MTRRGFTAIVVGLIFSCLNTTPPAYAATLFSTAASSGCSGYGMSAGTLFTTIPFTAPSGATLTGFDLIYSGGATTYMTVKVYSDNSGTNLLGTFTSPSLSGSTTSYTGNIVLPSAGTYWLLFKTGTYVTPCYTYTISTSGSASGWSVGGYTRESFDTGATWTTRSDTLNFKYTIYGNPVVALAINSITYSTGAPVVTYRTPVTLTANVTASSYVTFYDRGKRIPGCINIAATGTSPSMAASCIWRPSIHGVSAVTAKAVPSSGGSSVLSSVVSTGPVIRSNNR
jgi:hypothetical protein